MLACLTWGSNAAEEAGWEGFSASGVARRKTPAAGGSLSRKTHLAMFA
jgi:hypothetical protein